MPVITVSGRLASGARELAQAVAREMQLDYVDREILVEAAREMGVTVEAMEQRDQRTATLGERLASTMRTLLERSASAGTIDPMTGGLEGVLGQTYGEAAELPADTPSGQLDDNSYLRTLTSIITDLAARGDVVILGRGSQVILQHHADAFHVYVSAPRDQRVEVLAARESMAPEEAQRRIKKSDQNRQEFHRRYFKTDAENPLLYDVMLNGGRLTEGLMVSLVTTAARQRTPRPG